ncbi:hypothetical protein B0F90DRAFT_1818261 [Multifurca ochricompacta]|uniref:Uncharacterized protein n=1 Tax=Multifurca ochricompacta TaxID=376703 RepID=A0AAD4M4D7_9AGAM|nr:hypothetical protein B0F90DRAFT_1818261 [Multifurca ochricompacta]
MKPDDAVDVLSAVEDLNLKKPRQFTPRVDPMPLPVFTTAARRTTDTVDDGTTLWARTEDEEHDRTRGSLSAAHPDLLHASVTAGVFAETRTNPDPIMLRQSMPRVEDIYEHPDQKGIRRTRKSTPACGNETRPDDTAALSAAEDETTSNDAAASSAAEEKTKPDDTAALRAVED